MSKGYFLGKWLRIGESLHSEMRHLFLKNGLCNLELNRLPPDDRLRWYELKKKSDRVADRMCKLILS